MRPKSKLKPLMSRKATGGQDSWSTPPYVVRWLQSYIATHIDESGIEIDVCADASNAKADKFFDEAADGLKQKWKGVCFCNPPYSQIAAWVQKAFASVNEGETTVAMLIPARTDTRYWHDYIAKADEILFIKGRLAFGDPSKGNENAQGAPFPSAIVLFIRPWYEDKKPRVTHVTIPKHGVTE